MLKGIALAVIPTVIFMLSGILLKHWLLVIGSVLFGIGHICITYKNHEDYRILKKETD